MAQPLFEPKLSEIQCNLEKNWVGNTLNFSKELCNLRNKRNLYILGFLITKKLGGLIPTYPSSSTAPAIDVLHTHFFPFKIIWAPSFELVPPPLIYCLLVICRADGTISKNLIVHLHPLHPSTIILLAPAFLLCNFLNTPWSAISDANIERRSVKP